MAGAEFVGQRPRNPWISGLDAETYWQYFYPGRRRPIEPITPPRIVIATSELTKNPTLVADQTAEAMQRAADQILADRAPYIIGGGKIDDVKTWDFVTLFYNLQRPVRNQQEANAEYQLLVAASQAPDRIPATGVRVRATEDGTLKAMDITDGNNKWQFLGVLTTKQGRFKAGRLHGSWGRYVKGLGKPASEMTIEETLSFAFRHAR